MKGLKHLVECHCVLPQFRNKKERPYHKFVVFSVIDKADGVIPKHAVCNNCGVIHNVYDIGKSEILVGQESGAIIQKEDIELMIPTSISNVLKSYDCDISVWEHVLFVMQNSIFPEKIILSRDVDGEIISGKILTIEEINKYQIKPYSMRTSA